MHVFGFCFSPLARFFLCVFFPVFFFARDCSLFLFVVARFCSLFDVVGMLPVFFLVVGLLSFQAS